MTPSGWVPAKMTSSSGVGQFGVTSDPLDRGISGYPGTSRTWYLRRWPLWPPATGWYAHTGETLPCGHLWPIMAIVVYTLTRHYGPQAVGTA